MQIVFSDQSLPKSITKSIFLAGPSPRNNKVLDWRHEALKHLNALGYDGTVFIPIPSSLFYNGENDLSWNYDNQIQWECLCRQVADVILFWIPRDLNNLPGFTTNIEFGEDLASTKVRYGRPDSAEKCRYIDLRYEELRNNKVVNDLSKLISNIVSELGEGSLRENGEVYVPLFIWQSNQFKSWYNNLKEAGNRLDFLKLLHVYKIKNKDVFSYVIWVNIWIEKEKRFKNNEFVFTRTDISAVVGHYKENNEEFVILVKEFRSPVNNSEGFIYELPGGSSPVEEDQLITAKTEFFEETGLLISDEHRFKLINKRQLAATLSSHCCFLYKVKLNKTEFNILKDIELEQIKNTDIKIEDNNEKTYVKIINIKDLNTILIDYSTLGMIKEAIL